MPDRPRRTLRLLSRPRPRGPPNSRSGFSVSPRSPSTVTSTSTVSEPFTRVEYCLPGEFDPRVRSLDTGVTRSVSCGIDERGCESLPPGTGGEGWIEGREKRQGGRFEGIVEVACDGGGEKEDAGQEKSCMEKLKNGRENECLEVVLTELAELRAMQEEQREFMERLLVTVSSQSANVERRLDGMRIREKVEQPGAARVLMGGVVDALAIVVLYLLTWLVARPFAGVWRIVKWCRGGKKAEEGRRCSWRLSGRSELSSDPFLAGAAKRMSFSTAADFHD